ncbi:DNA primase [Streptomyces sp. NPDC088674]|uniref:DNA primase n=1 Tax=Streptomyces sp. NPDC088674 TaxID=3365869 RepID=UPI0038049D8B
MKTRRCEHCRTHLGARHAHNARYCSGRCRTAACRARRTVPAELVERDRWVRRSAAKVPLTVGGAVASSTNSATWSAHRAAARSTAGVGLGFVLDGDGVVVVDLDHCLTVEGALKEWARPVVEAASGCWVERSVSGEGLHIWGVGRLPGSGRRLPLAGGGTAEVYGSGRYIAVTGQTWGGAPRRLGDLQDLIDALL